MSPMVHPTGQLGWHAPIYVATSVPTMQALAAMPTPSVLVVVGGMLPPPMQAVAVLLLPSVSVTMPPIVVPLLTATAGMPAPQIRVDSPVTSSVMAAVAQFLAPVISKGVTVPAAVMAAVGAMPTPSVVVGVFAPITVPAPMTANAALLTPSVGAGVTLAAPLLHSTAAILPPSVGTSYAVTAPLLAATAAMLTPTVTVITGPKFDALGASVPNPGTTLSWQHTATAGANVFVVVSLYQSGSYPSTVKYGSATMTQYGTDAVDGSGSAYTGIRFYRLTSAPGGQQTVTVTSAQGLTGGNSISFTGVNNVSALQTNNDGGTTGTALSQAVSCTSNQIIVQSFGEWYNETITAYSGGTKQWIGYYQGNTAYGVQTLSTATATTTFTATDTYASYWVGAAIVLS